MSRTGASPEAILSLNVQSPRRESMCSVAPVLRKERMSVYRLTDGVAQREFFLDVFFATRRRR